MTHRIVVLDIDGVLNSAAWFEKMQAEALSRRPISNMIDPECVARLNLLLDLIGAQVVISSSWRIIHPIEEIDSALKEKGFTGTIIGKTPVCGPDRGAEIQEWLTDHGRDAEDVVIVDDDSDMGHLMPCLILTSWSCGLVDADVKRAAALFGVDVIAGWTVPAKSGGLRSLLGKAER